jgi:hypothetical protein
MKAIPVPLVDPDRSGEVSDNQSSLVQDLTEKLSLWRAVWPAEGAQQPSNDEECNP